MNRLACLVIASALPIVGCAESGPSSVIPPGDEGEDDERDEPFLSGDHDAIHGIAEGSPEAAGVLDVANTLDPLALRERVPAGVFLKQRAIDAIMLIRLGPDGVAGTGDEGFITTLAELDAVPFVGPVSFNKMLVFATEHDFIAAPSARTSELALGSQFSCRRTGAVVECWGQNTDGQLGNGTRIDSSIPKAVIDLPGNVIALAAGSDHVCARTTSTHQPVLCWGRNDFGALGDGTGAARSRPTAVVGLPPAVTQVTAGAAHTCARTVGGAVYCWGRFPIGDPEAPGIRFPQVVPGLETGVVEIASGPSDACARKGNGTVVCWGAAFNDQQPATPVEIDGLASATAIAVGSKHLCAVDDGDLLCRGANDRGQLGDGTLTPRDELATVPALSGGIVVSVTAQGDTTCAKLTGGRVKCWGRGTEGQLGNGATTDRNAPVLASGLGSATTELAAGTLHTCVIRAARTMCWGDGRFGALGTGDATGRSEPAVVAD
jgi:alpha-tubulin suppressor-like RCC1 family protein